MMQSMGTLVTAICISLIYSWKYALGILVFVPVMVTFDTLRFKMSGGISKTEQSKLEYAGKVNICKCIKILQDFLGNIPSYHLKAIQFACPEDDIGYIGKIKFCNILLFLNLV